MPYVRIASRIEQLNFRTTSAVKKALLFISKTDHRTMTNEIEYLISRRAEELKNEGVK